MIRLIKLWWPAVAASIVSEWAAVGLAFLAYEAVNMPAVTRASFLCPLAILASGLASAWLRFLPRLCGRIYRLQGKRFFLAGAIAGAFVLSFWTSLLDLWAGGLTAQFATNLLHVLPNFFTSLGIAVGLLYFLIFAVCVGWRRTV